MHVLKQHLAPLSREEREELLSEYENHFIFGIQSGRSEAELVTELGDPVELAKEALGDRYVEPKPIQARGGESSRTIFSLIMLFFVNIVIVPILLSFWVVVFSLGVSGIAGVLSPLLLGVDYMLNFSVTLTKVFLSIGFVGVGILLAIGMYYTGIGMWKLTRAYFRWNLVTVKGSR